MTGSDSQPAIDLTAFQRDVLAVLATLEEPNGSTVLSTVEDLYGCDINNGRLYPNLGELADAGLVAKGELDGRSNYYRLTDAGRDRLAADLRWRADALGFDVDPPEDGERDGNHEGAPGGESHA